MLLPAWNGWPRTLSGVPGEVEGEPVEQHHRDVDAAGPGGLHPAAKPVEVRLVEAGQVEPGLAVHRVARPRPGPRLRGHAQVHLAERDLRPDVLPPPEADEVVAVLLEEVEVGAEVEHLRHVGAVEPGAGAVVEVVVDVGTAQVHRRARASARGGLEVARIGPGDDEAFGHWCRSFPLSPVGTTYPRVTGSLGQRRPPLVSSDGCVQAHRRRASSASRSGQWSWL